MKTITTGAKMCLFVTFRRIYFKLLTNSINIWISLSLIEFTTRCISGCPRDFLPRGLLYNLYNIDLFVLVMAIRNSDSVPSENFRLKCLEENHKITLNYRSFFVFDVAIRWLAHFLKNQRVKSLEFVDKLNIKLTINDPKFKKKNLKVSFEDPFTIFWNFWIRKKKRYSNGRKWRIWRCHRRSLQFQRYDVRISYDIIIHTVCNIRYATYRWKVVFFVLTRPSRSLSIT